MPTAVSDAYATPLEYRSVVSKSDAGDDADVGADLLAISRWLDRKLGRFFTKDAAPVARVFYPRVVPQYNRPTDWAEAENPWMWGGYARWLFTDDMAEAPTSVIPDTNSNGLFSDDAALGATDVEPWPTNALLGPEPRPFTALFVPTWSANSGGFVTGQRVQITCRWGWPAVPEAIRRATIQLTAIWRLESPRATTRVDEMGTVVGTSKSAQGMVDELTRHYMRTSSLI